MPHRKKGAKHNKAKAATPSAPAPTTAAATIDDNDDEDVTSEVKDTTTTVVKEEKQVTEKKDSSYHRFRDGDGGRLWSLPLVILVTILEQIPINDIAMAQRTCTRSYIEVQDYWTKCRAIDLPAKKSFVHVINKLSQIRHITIHGMYLQIHSTTSYSVFILVSILLRPILYNSNIISHQRSRSRDDQS
jgi:hypothetical protein